MKMKEHKRLSLRVGTAAAMILLFSLHCGQVSRAEVDTSMQVTGLLAFHRGGQTFLLWDGIEQYGDLPGNSNALPGISQAVYKEKLAILDRQDKSGRKIRYRIYRSDKPMSQPAALQSAEFLAEVTPLSIYYPYHLGMYWQADKNKDKVIPALAVQPLQPLKAGQELYVHTVRESGTSYYAVITVLNDVENHAMSEANCSSTLVERTGIPQPILQRQGRIAPKEHYRYHPGPATIQYYVRWVDEPYSDQPRCFEWAVAVPDDYHRKQPGALQLALHSWGSTFDSGTYWYETSPASIRVATVNLPIQDWWYGYRKSSDVGDGNRDDVVFNYTERRLLSFLDWVKQQWNVDERLIFVEGPSMGGTGAMQLGMKRGDLFCYSNSWVGIGSWRNSTYFRKGESRKWGAIDELMNYNGVRFDDWMDLDWWLREYPRQETPFLSFGNGKNDGGIGWEQAVLTVKALQETKRPFVFVWGMSGHGQRARFMLDPVKMALNKSVPAFKNCTLDNAVGTATKLGQPQKVTMPNGNILDDWFDGDSIGQINAYLGWSDIVDRDRHFEINVYLTEDAPENTCLVDLTPRRTQKFKAAPGQKFKWISTSRKNNRMLQSGDAVADKWGLVTIERLLVTKSGNRITITP